MYRPFIEEIFQKTDLTQEDLERYFENERDETLFLEFKSFTEKAADNRDKELRESEKTKGVIKTINAFLNSSGGLLIWGAPEPKEVKRGKNKVKMCQGALSPVPESYDRDNFINKIASQISPLPQGVRMHPVTVNGGYVYLFEVPESQNKPHQYDGRYYVRMDTRTDVAPHYLVYALCRQVKNPELEISVTCDRALLRPSSDYITFQLTVNIENIVEGINDYDVYIKANSNDGGFIKRSNVFVKGDSMKDESSTMLFEDVAKILSSGLPVEYAFDVGVKRKVHPDPGQVVTIWFGGRNSKVKKTVFKIEFINQTIGSDNYTSYHDVSLEIIK